MNVILKRSSHYTLSAVAGIVTRPTATIRPSLISIQQGERAEFHCTATGNPTPLVEWTGTVGEKLTLKILSSFSFSGKLLVP